MQVTHDGIVCAIVGNQNLFGLKLSNPGLQ